MIRFYIIKIDEKHFYFFIEEFSYIDCDSSKGEYVQKMYSSDYHPDNRVFIKLKDS